LRLSCLMNTMVGWSLHESHKNKILTVKPVIY